jgi:glycerol kinase
MGNYILAIDQGTTGSTVLVFDKDAHVIGRGYQEFEQIFPKPGWVEHNPNQIWTSISDATTEAISKANIEVKEIAAIGITNQRETTTLWNRETSEPIYNSIVWQCRRTADLCDTLRNDGHAEIFQKKTGLILDAYFSGTKIKWILDNVENARQLATDSKLAFGTIDSYLVWRLSGNKTHITDFSNASRTLLMDLKTCDWDDALLELLTVPKNILPQIKSSSEVYAVTQGLDFLPDGIPISGIAGDQQAALFGQMCLTPGTAKCTYGTGAFALFNSGTTVPKSNNGLLATAAWQRANQTFYALEGSTFIAGAAVQWLRDGLGIINNASEIEALASSVDSSDGVVFVPALTGLAAPHWNPSARGAITGITRGTTGAHLARAALEGIAFQIYDVLTSMDKDLPNTSLNELKVDGGAAKNNLLMQFQADLLNVRIVRPKVLDTTASGAAFLAGLAIGFWEDIEQLKQAWQVDRIFEPKMPETERQAHLEKWQAAVQKL